MLKELESKSQEKMAKVLGRLKEKLKTVRTGRAHISLLEGLKVSYYGNLSELAHIASVSCPDARTLLISPWDQGALTSIEEAIVKSPLELAPQNDGKTIRLVVPELTEDRRKEIIRNFKKEVEKTRIELRQVRKEMIDQVRSLFKAKSISEDQSKAAENSIQSQIDRFNKQVDEAGFQKSKELIKV